MLAGALALGGLSGCVGPRQASAGAGNPAGSPASSAPGIGMPARLETGVSEACYEQIAAVVEKETGNRVFIGPGAFSTSDELVLVREPRRGPDGKPLDGRSSIPRPAVFLLSWSANQCLIAVARQGAPRVALPACRCQPR